MSKKPRPSINDQLAQIAAKGPPTNNAVTLPRDSVETLERGNVVPDNVVAGRAVAHDTSEEERDGYKRRVRFEKPHASVYAHPKVFKALREIAAAQDCKPHDLYLEGLRLVLRAHGRDFDALNRGE
jgi:hypothetical protein